MSNEPTLLKVIVWRDEINCTLHIQEIWSNGDDPEYIYEEHSFVKNPKVPRNIGEHYKRLGFMVK